MPSLGGGPSFFFQAEDGIRDLTVTGVQTCALPILAPVFTLSRDAPAGTLTPLPGSAIADPPGEAEEVYRALVTGTRDYVRKNGMRTVVLGLSGGVDSSLVACIAVDALGPESVKGVTMP